MRDIMEYGITGFNWDKIRQTLVAICTDNYLFWGHLVWPTHKSYTPRANFPFLFGIPVLIISQRWLYKAWDLAENLSEGTQATSWWDICTARVYSIIYWETSVWGRQVADHGSLQQQAEKSCWRIWHPLSSMLSGLTSYDAQCTFLHLFCSQMFNNDQFSTGNFGEILALNLILGWSLKSRPWCTL